MADKPTIIAALDKWIRQRPGLEFGNYGNMSSYRSEIHSISRDLRDARAMLRYIEWHASITAAMIMDAAKHSYSGRLLFVTRDDGTVTIDYCTGQYWPTEYRRAVCAVLSSVIWAWLRSNLGDSCTGDMIRKTAKRELETSIARRWFK
jgi:hypothetical protein